MNVYGLSVMAFSIPAEIIAPLSICVVFIIILSGVVLYMLNSRERSAQVAREVNRLTEAVGGGIVNFVVGGDGLITYASKGFYEMFDISRDRMVSEFGMSFYRLVCDEDAELIRSLETSGNESIEKELHITLDRKSRWMLLKGNIVTRHGRIRTLSAVVIDITENKLLVDRLALTQERYRIATELANDVIFSYSVTDDTLNLGENFSTYYEGENSVPDFSKSKKWEKGAVHPDDTEKVAELIRIITFRGNGIDQQIRVRDRKGDYVWCRLICVPIPDSTGECREYVGKLINIDIHKKQMNVLAQKAMHDPLTGAYNKEYSATLVNKYISDYPDRPGMLLIVDIDRFKNINDTYGHAVGDIIIIEVVKQVKAAFRADDIVGRIGGDEFIVFVCNVSNPEDQIKQAKKLHEVLRQPVTADGQVINKSASIGVALYPNHGSSYEELIKLADKALYKVKGSGKDSFIIYDSEDFPEDGQ